MTFESISVEQEFGITPSVTGRLSFTLRTTTDTERYQVAIGVIRNAPCKTFYDWVYFRVFPIDRDQPIEFRWEGTWNVPSWCTVPGTPGYYTFYLFAWRSPEDLSEHIDSEPFLFAP